jgi:leucyl-tRNA synthetase
MELVNQMYQMLENPSRDDHFWPVMKNAAESVMLLISPIVPHIAEELWHALGHSESILKAPWPKWKEDALRAEEVLVVVQVNGKLRSRIVIPADATAEQMEQTALGDAKTQDFIEGKTIKKIVVVPGKLVNIVV